MSRCVRLFLAPACFLAAAFLAGCDEAAEPSVVLYASADEHIVRQVVARFEAAHGIRVDYVGDVEAVKTTGLVERLCAERDRPRADVFWSSEILLTIDLADEGVLVPHRSEVADAWPEAHRDDDHRWFAFAARARVIVFAPAVVAPEQAPRTWMELTQSRWRGRVAMADPRFGTTGAHLACMKVYWDRHVQPGFFGAFLIGLGENEVRLLPSGNAGVVRAVANGEADLGLTDTDDVWAARAQGLAVDLVYPDHALGAEAGGGTLLIPNTVGRVADGPNPEAAGRLVDYLLSEEVERLLAESVSHNLPLRPGLAGDYPQHAVPRALDVDLRKAAQMRGAAVEAAIDLLGPAAAGDANDAG